MLADMYVSATLARSNCYYGAWALSTGADALGEPRPGAHQRYAGLPALRAQQYSSAWRFGIYLGGRLPSLLSPLQPARAQPWGFAPSEDRLVDN